MTIATTESSVIVACTGQSTFQFPFIGVSSSDITVSSIISSGIVTQLAPSTYTVNLNAANPNQLWGVGGSIVFSSAPSTGTSLLIQRTLPYTQTTSVQNQGNYYSQVTEQALDTLCMEIQQIAARTTQFRGTWTTGTAYNFGDVVQDGSNGLGTMNYYICQNSNTSGVWATDLANGDWAISVLAVVPTSNLPITLTGAISGNGTTSINTGITSNAVITSTILNNAVTLPKIAQIAANTVLCNPSGVSANVIATSGASLASSLGLFYSINIQEFSSSSTYTPTSGMQYCIIEAWGGGGGGGGVSSVNGASGAGGGAGAYARAHCSASTIGASQTVTIGSAGSAGSNAGGQGGTGGTTTVGSLISAGGGSGGVGSSSATGASAAGAGGAASVGDVQGTGMPGGFGINGTTTGFSGNGGSTSIAGGGIGFTVGNSAAGNGGNVGGGGGSGAISTSAAHVGGPGGTGYVIITEYIS